MNVKLKGFGRTTRLCIKGRIWHVHSSIWCEFVGSDVKLTYSSSTLRRRHVYEYHINDDALCFWPKKLRQRTTTPESIYIDRIIALLIQLKDKSDYDIFCHCVKETNILLHRSVFRLISIMREHNLKLKQCNNCSPKRKTNSTVDPQPLKKHKLDF